MKPRIALNRAGKLAAALAFFLSSALLLAAQSNKKTNNSAPPPQQKAAAPARPAAPAAGQRANAAPGNAANRGPGGAAAGNRAGAATGGVSNGGRGTAVGANNSGRGTTVGANNGGRGTPGGVNKGAGGAPGGVNKGAGGTTAGLNKGSGGIAGGGGGKPAGAHNVAAPYTPHAGATATKSAGGGTTYRNTNGSVVKTNARGDVKQISAPHGGGLAHPETMTVNRGPRGARFVETGHRGDRVVSYGPHRGFVERPLRRGYISRTYVYGGHSYAHVYREYRYHDVVYYHYVPAYYYGPRFYGYAVTPWGAPVVYVWPGAIAAPWYGYYGAYFTPYPVYASPDLWLTDYLIAENLRLAYESQQAGNANQPAPADDNGQAASAPLSPEVKQMIAEEVKRQLAEERAAAAQPPPSAAASSSPSQPPAAAPEQLPPAMNQKFFVVSSSIELTMKDGTACSLTPGDVIQRRGNTVDSNGGVAAEVVSSKQGDCPADADTSVQLADLQDMHNQLREQLDAGLGVLAKNDANKFPAGPASGVRSVAEGTAEATPGAEEQLASQETDASKLEEQVRQN